MKVLCFLLVYCFTSYSQTVDMLPVELYYWECEVFADSVQLRWGTATEVNNYGFNVERAGGDMEFVNVGFVMGHGNSSSLKHYTFGDTTAVQSSGKYYYRLMQIDNTGTFEYSDTLSVEIITSIDKEKNQLPSSFQLLQNYPNPFNSATNIGFRIPVSEHISLTLYDSKGEMVQSIFKGHLGAGEYNVRLNLYKFPSGIYYYRLNSGEQIITKKLLLLK